MGPACHKGVPCPWGSLESPLMKGGMMVMVIKVIDGPNLGPLFFRDDQGVLPKNAETYPLPSMGLVYLPTFGCF